MFVSAQTTIVIINFFVTVCSQEGNTYVSIAQRIAATYLYIYIVHLERGNVHQRTTKEMIYAVDLAQKIIFQKTGQRRSSLAKL